MLFSSFNLSQSFNYTPYLFYNKKRFKSEINSFCTVYGPQPNFVHIYSYNLWEGLRCIERERSEEQKPFVLWWLCVGGAKQPVFQPKEAEPLYIITFQSIQAVLQYKPNSIALAIYN